MHVQWRRSIYRFRRRNATLNTLIKRNVSNSGHSFINRFEMVNEKKYDDVNTINNSC